MKSSHKFTNDMWTAIKKDVQQLIQNMYLLQAASIATARYDDMVARFEKQEAEADVAKEPQHKQIGFTNMDYSDLEEDTTPTAPSKPLVIVRTNEDLNNKYLVGSRALNSKKLELAAANNAARAKKKERMRKSKK